MALIVCRECGNQISDQATACPHCGCPVQPQNIQSQNIQTMGGYPQQTGVYTQPNSVPPQQKGFYSQPNQNIGQAPMNNVPNMVNTQPTGKKKSDGLPMLGMIVCSFLYWVGFGMRSLGVTVFFALCLLGCCVAECKITKYNIEVGQNGGSVFKKPNDVWGAYFIILLFVGYLGVKAATIGRKDDSSQRTSTNVSVEQTTTEPQIEFTFSDPTPTIEEEKNSGGDLGISTASDYSNMLVGDIGKVDDGYIGLSYVKRMNYVPSRIQNGTDIGAGNEIIIGFFDFLNGSSKKMSITFDDITCYADGVKVDSGKSTFVAFCDGVPEYNFYESIDPFTELITMKNFAVPVGWNEIRFYYKSKCIWVVGQDDVFSEEYSLHSLYPLLNDNSVNTPEETVIFDNGCELIYMGATDYTDSNIVLGESEYIVLKFKLNNTSSSVIDLTGTTYRIHAYQNNCYLGHADGFSDNIDGFRYLYYIKEVEPGMSADFYVAFEKMSNNNNFYVVCDEGFVGGSSGGEIYVKE